MDKYGRLLAFVEVDERDVGIELLKQGLARTLFIGPCAVSREEAYKRLERNAFLAGRGMWSFYKPRQVAHKEAGKFIGKLMSVTGRVQNVFVGPTAVHLNFGSDYRSDFTAVIFRKNLSRLSHQGLQMPVTRYKGLEVEVTGIIKDYNGPEIVIDSADQIRFRARNLH